MDEKYKSEDEIIALVNSFEDASIARGVWKHGEHLVVALYYVSKYDLETAIARTRAAAQEAMRAAAAVPG